MSDQQALATAIAAFARCNRRLREAEMRLLALLSQCAEQARVRLDVHQRLPFAAHFSPFSALSTAATEAPVSAPGCQKAVKHAVAAKRRTRVAESAAASADSARAAQVLHNTQLPAAATSVPPPEHATRNAAADLASSTRPDAAVEHSIAESTAPTSAAGRRTGPLPASSTAAASVPNAGHLVEALLQRHAAPRMDSRLAGLHRQSMPTTRARTTGQLPADNRLPNDWLDNARAASAANDGGRNQDSPPADSTSSSAVGRFDVLSGRGRTEHTAQPGSAAAEFSAATASATAAAVARSGSIAFEHGDDLLRTLLAPGNLNSSAGARSRQRSRAASQEQASASIPQQRVPSRLLGGISANLVTALPDAAQSSPPAAALFTTPNQAAPLTTDEVASALDQLLREQAWLRGVDLT